MKQMSAKDFVDSNAWLYSLIKSPESERKNQIADQLLDNLGLHVVSSQVIRECLTNLFRKVKADEVTIRELIESWYLHKIIYRLKTHKRLIFDQVTTEWE
jgi:predicted nucleic acid-binding protein